MIKVKHILEFLDNSLCSYDYQGDIDLEIDGFSSLNHYVSNTITWVKKSENWSSDKEAIVALCVVESGIEINVKNQIICNNSKKVFFSILEAFFYMKKERKAIGSNSTIGENVNLGENVFIGNNCSIEGEISIGDNTVIANNVVISGRVTIGHDCEIQSSVVIGESGFGFYEDGDGKRKLVKHFGGVRIGNDVFIGAHTNIAKGTLDDTYIGDGVKIAPSTHIGHNNYIESDATVICSQLYGSVSLGNRAYVVGSIVKNQCVVGDNSMIGMGSIVTKNIEPNKVAVGAPAKVIREK